MGIKCFWKNNKENYLWSCLILLVGGLFIGVVKKMEIKDSLPLVLFTLPLAFIMAYGIYEFTGGDKE